MSFQDAFDRGFSAVKLYVDKAIADAMKRVDAIEQRGLPVSVTSALIDRTGGLVLTFSDGSTKDLGAVCGANGTDGADGRDGKDGAAGVGIADATQNMAGELILALTTGETKNVGKVSGANGSDGAHGLDGAAGLGFDDMAADYDGERGIVLRFTRGEQVKEFAFTMPVVIDRGVWIEGKDYAAGDAVTWAGSVWIAQKDTSDKPDGGDGWRLSVKRGRDGKPGKDGELKAVQPVKVG